jgi:serine protease Do
MLANDRQGRAAFDESFAAMAERLRQSTVHVRSGRQGSGSGVIWRADGLLVTNAHVARGPRAGIEFWDGRTVEAEVMATDPQRDLAALSVPVDHLPAAPVADSSGLRVGQLVVAMGNPLGLSGALTVGIIHAIAPVEDGREQTWVQADVHLAPGNSGGPLADVLGRVVGINSMVAGDLGLAVPANDVVRFLQMQGRRVRLGVTVQPVTVGSDRVFGLLLVAVEVGSAAHQSGLIVGDVLLALNGAPLRRPSDLAAILADTGSDTVVAVDLLRGGRPTTVTVMPAASREAA